MLGEWVIDSEREKRRFAHMTPYPSHPTFEAIGVYHDIDGLKTAGSTFAVVLYPIVPVD